MNGERLNAAARTLRARAVTEAILRDGDPYYATEASAWERLTTPDLGHALADWLDIEAGRNPERATLFDGVTIGGPLLQALAVADVILGGQ